MFDLSTTPSYGYPDETFWWYTTNEKSQLTRWHSITTDMLTDLKQKKITFKIPISFIAPFLLSFDSGFRLDQILQTNLFI